MKNIKTGNLVIAFFYLIFLTSCTTLDINNSSSDVSNRDYSASESFSYEFAVKNQSQVFIDAINSTINVVSTKNISKAKIWGERIVKSDSEADATSHLKKLEAIVTDTDNAIYLETNQPSESNGRDYLVNYNLSIPSDWNVEIKIINGVVEIDSSNSDLEIEMINGDIRLNEIDGNLDIHLTNGKVDCKMTLPEAGKCEITSVNAEIQLAIPKITSANFAAGVVNGIVKVSSLDFQNLQSANNFVNGMLGNGDGTIRLEAVNGLIDASGF
jgi:hypothetical protein